MVGRFFYLFFFEWLMDGVYLINIYYRGINNCVGIWILGVKYGLKILV